MTREEFISLLRQPETVTEKHIPELKNLVDSFPYFVQARMLYVKALKKTNNIHYGAESKRMALYAPDRRRLYFYLNPDIGEKTQGQSPLRKAKVSSGEYFDMMDAIDKKGGDSRQSLKELAERLKAARELASYNLQEETEQAEVLPMTKVDKVEFTEENAKKMIREKKYAEALEILEALNLNNPKKSSYFADQIRFLETIVINTKR